jgi:hypothetical protein
MEVLLSSLNGLNAARHIAKVMPGRKILFLATQASSRHAADAFKAGDLPQYPVPSPRGSFLVAKVSQSA